MNAFKIRQNTTDRVETYKFEYSDKAEDKREFLSALIKDNKIPDRTLHFYASVLFKVDKIESELGTDWANFTDEQIDTAYLLISSKSINTLNAYTTVIKEYLMAITPRSTTILTGFDAMLKMKQKRLKGYVDKAASDLRYMTPDEFAKLMSKKGDPQVKSACIFLYYGIKGEEYTDLCNLRVEDINFKTGTVVDRKGNELATIDKKYLDIIKSGARTEDLTIYGDDGSILDSMELADRPCYMKGRFFLRTRRGSLKSNDEPLSRAYFSRLLSLIKDSSGNPHINGQTIYSSGDAWRLIEYVGLRMPRMIEWIDYKKVTGSSLSQASFKTICKLLVDRSGLN